MGITGLIPFLEKASRRANVSEFSGSTVAIDSYCWLHKGAFACADKLVRGEETDVHIRYCLKYVTMLLSKNIKPILVFDGRHLPAKALTELKRRESRDISKKRAAELLTLGRMDEARSYMRRSVDITHAMALSLIKECRKRNVDCIVAPYEADAQLAYLNIKNIAQLVITEDSDLILFGCTKVLFKMDLDGTGTLVDTTKLPLVMKCPIEKYTFDKFRQMCIMSGCDYLASLPGIGLAKARQFITATQDSNIANALRKLPSFFNRSNLIVTDEYRTSFLKAEATFKHQYVYDPIERKMCRLSEPDDTEEEIALCSNAGELLDERTAFQLALGNIDPFTLKTMDDWDPDHRHDLPQNVKTNNWKDKGVASHPSIWNQAFSKYMTETNPWSKPVKKQEAIIAAPVTRSRKKVVNLVSKYVPETQDESLSIESLSNMYCIEPVNKKQKITNESETYTQYSQNELNTALLEDNTKEKSPILQNKQRSFKKCLKNGTSYSVLKQLSRFPRTVLDENVIESKFFSTPVSCSNDSVVIEESPEKELCISVSSENVELSSSQKENSPLNSPVKAPSPILKPSPHRNPFRKELQIDSQDVIENTYPMEQLVTPVDSQASFGESPETEVSPLYSQFQCTSNTNKAGNNRNNLNSNARKTSKPSLKKSPTLPSNQPTLLSKFGFQKKPVLRK